MISLALYLKFLSVRPQYIRSTFNFCAKQIKEKFREKKTTKFSLLLWANEMQIWSEMVAKNAKFRRYDFSFSLETLFLRNYAQRNSDWKPYGLCCYATARLLFFVHSSIQLLEITITVPFSLMGLLSHGPARWWCVYVKTYLRSLSLKVVFLYHRFIGSTALPDNWGYILIDLIRVGWFTGGTLPERVPKGFSELPKQYNDWY